MPQPQRSAHSDSIPPSANTSAVGTGTISHICPLCEKAFGKSTKLERHLLQHHSATLSISSDVLPPQAPPSVTNPTTTATPTLTHPTQPTPASLTHTIDAVLSESNQSFDAGATHCRLCPSGKLRKFATRKDLAVHLVAKHATMRSDNCAVLSANSMPADNPTSPPLSARSQIRPGCKRGAEACAVDTPAKRARVEPLLPVSGTKPPVTPKKVRAVLAPKTSALAACKSDGAGSAGLSLVKTAGAVGGNDGGNVSVLASVQKDVGGQAVVQAGGQAGGQAGVQAGGQAGVQARQAATETAGAVLDFSAMAGIFANKHKSYYRLVDA